MIGHALASLLLAGATGAPPSPALPPGEYAARMCVTVAAQPANCGPVAAQVDAGGDITVRVHDFRYLIQFAPRAVIVLTLHGGMLVSEALSTYRWAGRTLLFADSERGLQYEIDLAPPAAASGVR